MPKLIDPDKMKIGYVVLVAASKPAIQAFQSKGVIKRPSGGRQ